MSLSKLQAALQSAASADDKPAAYASVLTDLTSSSFSDTETQAKLYTQYLDSLISSNLGIISTRPILTSLISSLASAPAEVRIAVGSHVTETAQLQGASFEEQNTTTREILASGYEQEEEWSKAAQALQGIPLESAQRPVSDLVKGQTWIRIVRCYLEDDDTVSAETALNKIKNNTAVLQVVQDSPELQLHYQLSQARILDSRRDFLNASEQYFAVSQSQAIAEEDRLQALSAAIKTAILAGAGTQRSRMLDRLYRDERSADVQEYAILEKMNFDRLLSPAEIKTFSESLMAHQLALTADGSTVLSKAATEHNLRATSKLYSDISTASLANILDLKDDKKGTAAEKAEEIAARMIEQGRLRAEIDQIDGVIRFAMTEDVNGAGKIVIGGERELLRLWDLQVTTLVEEVERIATRIGDAYPHLVNGVM